MGSLWLQAHTFPTLHVSCKNGWVTTINWIADHQGHQKMIFGDTEEKQLLDKLHSDLLRYFAGERCSFTWPLQWGPCTDFQKKVWTCLQSVPYGQTRSYAWIAKQIGADKAVRAVGTANGRNPFPLIVPCHRIIREDGAIGGYSPGTEIKRKLLALEGLDH
jgi:methylated-DNA-[protein]-cysteine S-methyltransferase